MKASKSLRAPPRPPLSVIHFPEGLPGFENHTHFTLVQEEELQPIVFLLSLVDPGIQFPVVPIQKIHQNYQLQLSEEDRRTLVLAGEPVVGENLLCLAILTLGDGTQPATANLFAPIVVNLESWMAKQVILFNSNYSVTAEV